MRISPNLIVSLLVPLLGPAIGPPRRHPNRTDTTWSSTAACRAASRPRSPRAPGRGEVLLIEPTRHVGGLSTSGINTAETEHMLKWTIGGFALEFYERLGKHYGTGKPEYLLRVGRRGEGLPRHAPRGGRRRCGYGAGVDGVEKDGAADHWRSPSPTARRLVGEGLRRRQLRGRPHGPRRRELHVGPRGRRRSSARRPPASASTRRRARPAPWTRSGALLPGISAWAKDLKEGDAHRGVMNYNFRLTFAKDPATPGRRSPRRSTTTRDATRLLENWLREQAAPQREGREARRHPRLLPASQRQVRGEQQAGRRSSRSATSAASSTGPMPTTRGATRSSPITRTTPSACSTSSPPTRACPRTSATR